MVALRLTLLDDELVLDVTLDAVLDKELLLDTNDEELTLEESELLDNELLATELAELFELELLLCTTTAELVLLVAAEPGAELELMTLDKLEPTGAELALLDNTLLLTTELDELMVLELLACRLVLDDELAGVELVLGGGVELPPPPPQATRKLVKVRVSAILAACMV